MRGGLVFLSGLLFAVGLGVSGMTDPANVKAFLDVTGAWNPALMLVMGGALGTYALAYRLARRRGRPLFAPAWPPAPPSGGYLKLTFGAALFGAGWALAGYCPGPAVVAAGGGSAASLLFLGTMLVGLWLGRLSERRGTQPEAEDGAVGARVALDGN